MSDPTPGNTKAIAAVLSGAVVVIVVWATKQFLHIEMPGEVAGAFQTVFTTGMVWLAPHGGDV